MRLFVAVDIPEALRDAIESEVVEPLRDCVPGARWTQPEGRHLTLKFLGRVEDDRVDGIAEALRRAAAFHEPFDASFAEIGGFPNLGRPRVLWIGVEQGGEQLSNLAGTVEAELEALGFEAEGRAFRGHLTLARFARPKRIDVPEIELRLDPFPVGEIVLFESRLHPKGARYSALERFPLRA